MSPAPPRLIPGTWVLPDAPTEDGDRLVWREPLVDTLRPLAVVAILDLLACLGIAAVDATAIRIILLFVASGLSFLTLALVVSLVRRAEVVFDRRAGVLRIRRPELGPLERPLSELDAVTVGTVEGGDRTVPAAGLALRDGWLPLHVAWSPRRGGDVERVRAVARRVAEHVGVPLEDSAGGPASPE